MVALCADCGIRPVAYRRTRCLECLTSKPMRESHPSEYRPDDHRGKRAALKVLIEAARKAGKL